jgi:hypothetical protein
MRNSQTDDMKRLFCIIIFISTLDRGFGQTLTKEQKQTKADSALYALFSIPFDVDTTKYSLKYPAQSYLWTTTTKRRRVLERGYFFTGRTPTGEENLTDGQQYIYNKKKMIFQVKYYKSGKLIKDSILKAPIPAVYLENLE